MLQSHIRVGRTALIHRMKLVLRGATMRAGARRARTARAIAFAITIGSDAKRSNFFDSSSTFAIAGAYADCANRSRLPTAVASKFVRITPGSMSVTSMFHARSS